MGIFCTIKSPDYMDTAIMVLEGSALPEEGDRKVWDQGHMYMYTLQ